MPLFMGFERRSNKKVLGLCRGVMLCQKKKEKIKRKKGEREKRTGKQASKSLAVIVDAQ